MNAIKSKKKNHQTRIRPTPKRTEGERSSSITHILCEGKTEMNYIKHLITPYKPKNIKVILAEGSNPVTIVDHGKEIIQDNPGDDVYCVFDYDDPKGYKSALAMIRDCNNQLIKEGKRSKFFAITSTPSIELWFLLHFVDNAPYYMSTRGSSRAQKLKSHLRKNYIYNYDEATTDWHEELIDQDKAIERAIRLLADNDKTGSINPSTNMHELVLMIREIHQQKMQHLKKPKI